MGECRPRNRRANASVLSAMVYVCSPQAHAQVNSGDGSLVSPRSLRIRSLGKVSHIIVDAPSTMCLLLGEEAAKEVGGQRGCCASPLARCKREGVSGFRKTRRTMAAVDLAAFAVVARSSVSRPRGDDGGGACGGAGGGAWSSVCCECLFNRRVMCRCR